MSAEIELIFLGTNGWYSSSTGDTVCILIRLSDCYIILDAGSGIQKADQYINQNLNVYMFLSHLHIDHVSGLHTLNKFNFNSGLTISGPEGFKRGLNTLVNQPYTLPLEKLKYPVSIEELDEGSSSKFPFHVEARDLIHPSRCFGYRFEINGKIITYCTDTGYCDNILELGKDADILITECSAKDGKQTEWPHLTPVEAAKAAREANAKKLILTHFDAVNYNKHDHRVEAENLAKTVFEQSIASYDGLRIEL